MGTVFISKGEYTASLADTIYHMLDQTAKDRVHAGTKVLIKPNFLLPAPPSHGILTHPLVVHAAASWALSRGASVTISDSPAIGPFKRILKEGGYLDIFRDLDVAFAPFSSPVQVDIGPPFGAIELAAEAIEADFIINLPKLKTHVMVGMTLGVKNLFGCVIGMKKTQWHFQAGVDRDLFARLLVQIARTVNPGVTLLDGILALEGEGPGRSGTPKHVGILAASTDMVGMDAVIAQMVGCDLATLPVHRAAVELGLYTPPEVIGEIPIVSGFVLPKLGSTGFGPESFQKLMRRHLLERPVVNSTACRLCGLCAKQCPAKVIRMDSRLHFDYDRCIRCYCCVEVCPHGALTTRTPLAGKMLRQIRDWAIAGIQRLRPAKDRKPH